MIDHFRVATRAAEYNTEAQAAGIRRNVYVPRQGSGDARRHGRGTSDADHERFPVAEA